MQRKIGKKLPSFILCTVLIVAMALCTAGCNGGGEDGPSSSGAGSDVQADAQKIGEGSTEFPFTVVDREGNETCFEVHTDKATVGEALLELGLIAGDDGEYGLFVKTVNGITADYDKDGVYWAFYIDGEYAMSGVDSTQIKDGESYSFKVE